MQVLASVGRILNACMNASICIDIVVSVRAIMNASVSTNRNTNGSKNCENEYKIYIEP